MAAGATMAMSLKGEERITLDWTGEGPLKKIVVEATRTGEVRGYVDNPKLGII